MANFSRDMLILDVSRLVWRTWQGLLPTGIDRTCLAYVAHYRDRAHALVQGYGMTRVLTSEASRRLFELVLSGTGGDARVELFRCCAPALFASGRAKRLNDLPYINVGHTGLDKPAHVAWLRRSGVRPVYFVHDLIPLTHPEYCRPGEPEKHLRRMASLLGNGVGVIGNSRHTLNELADFAGLQRELLMPPSLVAPLGVGKVAWQQEAEEPNPLLAGRPYFVMLGTIEGRKNHLLILNIWADLARRLGEACPQLVVIGQRGWESEQAVDMLERCEAIHGHVIELPRCEDAQLAAYMAGARALLFPSFVEGYGLPLVEALSLGTPVIASDLAVFRELAGEIPDYLSPLDGLGWARSIEDYAKPDSTARAAQVSRMQAFQTPRWRDHFALVDQWLAQLGFMPQPAQMPSD